MDKIDFLLYLINQETTNEMQPRWIRPGSFPDGSKYHDYWMYHQPGVDTTSPQLQLKNEGYVEYTNYNDSDKPEIYTYEQFVRAQQEDVL